MDLQQKKKVLDDAMVNMTPDEKEAFKDDLADYLLRVQETARRKQNRP
jgi:hypothetical protein